MKASFIAQLSDAGSRLDHFLVRMIPDISRSKIQKIIKMGGVTVADNPITSAHHFLKEGDVIVFKTVASTPEKSISEDRSKPLPIEVIEQTDDYIIINKPSGLLVHPTDRMEAHTVASWIKQKYPQAALVGDEPTLRPGIMHRLDKDASGLMVIALNQKSYDMLKAQFQSRSIYKEYSVLTHGLIEEQLGTIDFPIARSKQGGKMAARPNSQDGKEAITHYEIEKKYANATLLRVKPKTGRTHQIRVHLFAVDHAIVGDPLYQHKKQNHKLDDKCGRLFLHATKLGFVDLSGNKVAFEVALPDRLTNFLKTLTPKV